MFPCMENGEDMVQGASVEREKRNIKKIITLFMEDKGIWEKENI